MNAKLREALENCMELAKKIDESLGNDESTVWNCLYERSSANSIVEIAKSALVEQKYEAKWKLGAEYEYAYCSHCGRQQWASWDSYREAIENIGEFHKEYKFCPNCGFEMKGDC
jgi:hypothetical protein